MRIIFNFLLLLCLSIASLTAQEERSGQDRSNMYEIYHRLSFAYDEAGNRVSKELIFLTPSVRSSENVDSLQNKNFVKEYITHYEVRLYPNPTYGRLAIEIPNLDKPNMEWSISIHKLNGNLLQSQRVAGRRVELDITSYEAGLYLLFIRLGKEESRWKIIKK